MFNCSKGIKAHIILKIMKKKNAFQHTIIGLLYKLKAKNNKLKTKLIIVTKQEMRKLKTLK
jgi:hypothetical protein